MILGDNLLALGPELTVSTPFSKEVLAKTNETTITVASQTSAELLLGAKLRLLRSLVIGAGAGPGLTQGWGTPVFFAVGSVAYEPLPPRAGAEDTDGDGIVDPADACRTARGVRSEDPKKNGCPPDTDGDGILDAEDACPKERATIQRRMVVRRGPTVTASPTPRTPARRSPARPIRIRPSMAVRT